MTEQREKKAVCEIRMEIKLEREKIGERENKE